MSNIDSFKTKYVPIGTIIPFSSTTLPYGFVECDGTQFSKTGDYHLLYAAIGVMYGETDGSNGVGTTHFRIPNYVDMYLRGHAGSSTEDPDKDSRLDRGDGTVGNFVGTRQNNELQRHNHSLYRFQYNIIPSGGGGSAPSQPVRHNGSGSYVQKHSNVAESQSGAGSETRPDSIKVIYAIKVI